MTTAVGDAEDDHETSLGDLTLRARAPSHGEDTEHFRARAVCIVGDDVGG